MVVDTDVVEKSKNVNKALYKLELLSIKTIPFIIAFAYITNTILSYFDIKVELISMFCGISVLPFFFLLISSFAFKFCRYHRMMIYYIGVDETLSWIDMYHKIPISDNMYFVVSFTIFGVFLLLALYFKLKNKWIEIFKII